MFMGFGFFFMVLFTIGAIALVVWGINNFPGYTRSEDSKPHSNSAREILDQRYAKGEISDEEYESMKNKLNS